MLHDLHVCCTARRPLSPELREWLQASLARYLDHDCDTLNEAFGLIQGHGGVPWWLERGIRQRDEALRALALRYYPDDTAYARAKAVAIAFGVSRKRFEMRP